ncbi:MAG: ABC transporter permease, partial [Deltaproteobacteria bacterium]
MIKKTLKQLIFYLILISLWEILARSHIWPEYLFPPPLKVLETLIEGFKNLSFIIAIGISLKRIIIGYGISILFGSALGVLINKFKILDETLGSLILGLQTLPSICWLPLALLWFGLNERAIIFVVIMGALFSITIAIDTGIKHVNPLYIRIGRNMGARKLILLKEVIIPAALPYFVSGLKQGWSFAWRSLMAGELLFVSLGLGYLLQVGRELNDMSQVMAVIFIIALISALIDKCIFSRIELN